MNLTDFARHVTTTRETSKREAITMMRAASLRTRGVKLDARGRTRDARGRFTPDPLT